VAVIGNVTVGAGAEAAVNEGGTAGEAVGVPSFVRQAVRIMSAIKQNNFFNTVMPACRTHFRTARNEWVYLPFLPIERIIP